MIWQHRRPPSVLSCLSPVIALVVSLALGATPAGAQPLGDDTFEAIDAIAEGVASAFFEPLDAAPNPDASTIFFVATGPDGPTIFSVDAAGGKLSVVAGGAPFVAPRNLVVSADGARLYVADPGAETGLGPGAIFVVALGGNGPVVLAGSEGTAPQAIETIGDADREQIVFSGVDPASGRPAAMSLPEVGAAAPEVLAAGDPLGAPDGVVAAPDGRVFVVDRGSGEAASAAVYQIESGALSLVTDGVRPGAPAGIALSRDNRVLAVSALSDTGTSQVLLVDLETGATGTLSKVIGANSSSGGLHRARHADVFAWCGVTAGTGGQGVVYRIST
jgi:DNA-binding beta-propeller fold protein YncE